MIIVTEAPSGRKVGLNPRYIVRTDAAVSGMSDTKIVYLIGGTSTHLQVRESLEDVARLIGLSK